MTTRLDRPFLRPKVCSSKCPTAWAYISSQPSLSAVAGLLRTVGLDTALSGPFPNTLLLPTNEVCRMYAWAANNI
jgi:hypothetical protein